MIDRSASERGSPSPGRSGVRYHLPTMGARSHTVPVLVAAACAVLFGACSDDDEADPTKPDAQEVLDVSVDETSGTCMMVSDTFPPEVEELPVIDCAHPHSHEIYATVEYDEGDVYPGLSELETFAQTACLTEFDTFVGISAFDSTLSYSWLVPTLDGWNEEDDRDILCVLQDAEGAGLDRTMRDAKR